MYSDTNGLSLIIQNGGPKDGMKYTDPDGKVYSNAVFEGAHGNMRIELSLKGQNLYYKLKIDGSKSNTKSDDKEIQCGSINLKNFVIQ